MTEIVVGVDGSQHSVTALGWADRETRIRHADLVAVLVWDLFNQRHVDGSRRFDPAYDSACADAALRATLEAALGSGRAEPVARRTPCDEPAPGLLRAADHAELLVVGARGLGGFRGLLLGSVSQQCLHHARVPIAVIRTTAVATPGEPAPGRIVVGADGSPASNAALRWALGEGTARGATVEVVHAWEPPAIYGPVPGSDPFDPGTLEESAHRLVDDVVGRALAGPAAVDVRRTVVAGGPAAALLDAAKGADLVVVGRRGLGGFGRLLLGSVSEQVVHHAPCPVVVLPADHPEE
jgi:nucleotide-binding universal stress UspA family protein